MRRGPPEDLSLWPRVEELALPEDKRGGFRRRKEAIELYNAGASHKEIRRKTKVDRHTVRDVWRRAHERHSDGRIMGERAFVRFQRTADARSEDPRKLIATKPTSGVLGALFGKFPGLCKRLAHYALTGKRDESPGKEVNVAFPAVFEEFGRLLKEFQILEPHWPHNSDSGGAGALRAWYRRLKRAPMAVVEAIAPLGYVMAPAARCYQRVQIDGHRIDLHAKIRFPSPNGIGTVDKRISRLWLIVIVEVRSRAILGYSIAYGTTNYGASAVIRALRSALSVWKPKKLSAPGAAYAKGDGFPSALIPNLAHACWDETQLDNSKSHLCGRVMDCLDNIGSVPIFNPAGEPDNNAFVEGFFKILEEWGLHRIPGTTGSSPADPKRADDLPVLEAHVVEELIDLLIARINNSRAPDCDQTRLAILDDFANRQASIIRRLPEFARSDPVPYDLVQEITIAADEGEVLVRFKGARYTSDVLKSARGLVGRRAVVFAKEQEGTSIRCSLTTGEPLGHLVVERRYRDTPHSLLTRREAHRWRKTHSGPSTGDIIADYTRFAFAQAASSKAAATTAARLRSEQAPTSGIEGASKVPSAVYCAPIEQTEDIISSRDDDVLSEFGVMY